jgi:Baseplate J-like protein
MNPDTVNLIERPYQEVVDDLLTAIVGGVVNEPILFDLKEDLYPLAQPAQDVRGITGTVDTDTGQQLYFSFQKTVDFLFDASKNAVVWQEGGKQPADESTFYVDYFRQNSQSPLTDINVGSVTRTLTEAIGREIATVYGQVNKAYLSAFIDTAEGKSLDLVVAILGITRKTKDFAVGLVTFFRDPAIEGNITIPQSTLLLTTQADATFQTIEPRTLQRGQVRIDLPVRAGDGFKGAAGKVEAGAITTLTQPIAGIARVTNFEATFLGAEDESDPELRDRAKAALRGLGKATLLALARVIAEGNATLTEVWEPNSPLGHRTDIPGTVTLLVESEPERFPSLRGAVEETRAAGVQVTLVARYVFFKPRLTARIAAGLPPSGKVKLLGQIIEAIQKYVDGLKAGDAAKGADILQAIQTVKEVSDPKIVDVMAWRSDVGQPGAETLVDSLLEAIAMTPKTQPDALRNALIRTLTETPQVPTNRRIADRSLIQNLTGQRASDSDIDRGEFQVALPGAEWWVVLDLEPADIVLLES